MAEQKSKFRWLVGIVIAVVAAGGGGTAWLRYFESQTDSDGSISSWTQAQPLFFESFDLKYENPDVWPIGEDGFWHRSLENGAYCFSNQQGDGEVDYHYLEVEGRDNSELPVGVDIRTAKAVENESLNGSGLLYRFDQTRRFYYAIALTSAGQLNVYKRNSNGYNTLYSGAVPALKEGSNRLAVIGDDAELHVYINDVLFRVIEDGELKQGISGMIGIGIGRHCFDNFGIYEKLAEIPQ